MIFQYLGPFSSKSITEDGEDRYSGTINLLIRIRISNLSGSLLSVDMNRYDKCSSISGVPKP